MLIIAVLIVFLSTFLLAALAVGIAWLIMQKREPALAGAPGLSLEDTPTLLKADELSSISLWDRLLARFDFVEGMRTRIEQAGLNWSVGRVTAMILLIGSFALAVLTSISLIPGWAAAVLAGLAGLGPYLYILRLRSRRFARFEE